MSVRVENPLGPLGDSKDKNLFMTFFLVGTFYGLSRVRRICGLSKVISQVTVSETGWESVCACCAFPMRTWGQEIFPSDNGPFAGMLWIGVAKEGQAIWLNLLNQNSSLSQVNKTDVVLPLAFICCNYPLMCLWGV